MTLQRPMEETAKNDLVTKLDEITKVFGISCKHKNVQKFRLLNGTKRKYCKECSTILSGTAYDTKKEGKKK